jgi:phage terminase small subunit
MSIESDLLAREELFIAAYVANGGNAAAAAREAGYSAKGSAVRGAELLARPRVKDAIERERQKILKRYDITKESVLQEMAAIAFSRFSHYVMTRKDGRLALSKFAPSSAAAAVKRVKRKQTTRYIRTAQDDELQPEVETEIEFELWNKDAELGRLSDHLGLTKENRNLLDDNALNPLARLSRDELEGLAVELIKKAARNKRSAEARRS